MTRVEATVEILAPVEKVFAFIANPNNYEKILEKSEVNIEMLSKGPIGVGTQYLISVPNVGSHLHEYVEFVENQRVTDHEIEGKLKRDISTTRFEATDRGTKVTWTIDYALPYSFLGVIFGKLTNLEKTMDIKLKSGLENAKKILEV